MINDSDINIIASIFYKPTYFLKALQTYFLRQNSEQTIDAAIDTLSDSTTSVGLNDGMVIFELTQCSIADDMPFPSFPKTIIPAFANSAE